MNDLINRVLKKLFGNIITYKLKNEYILTGQIAADLYEEELRLHKNTQDELNKFQYERNNYHDWVVAANKELTIAGIPLKASEGAPYYTLAHRISMLREKLEENHFTPFQKVVDVINKEDENIVKKIKKVKNKKVKRVKIK